MALALPKQLYPGFGGPAFRPTTPVKLDRTNPLTRGMDVAIVSGQAVNLANNQPWTTSNTGSPTNTTHSIDCPDNSWVKITNLLQDWTCTAYTIHFRMRINATPPTWATFWAKPNGGADQISFGHSASTGDFFYTHGTDYAAWTSLPTIASLLGEWHDYVLSYNSTDGRTAYVDTLSATENKTGNTVFSGTGDLILGSDKAEGSSADPDVEFEFFHVWIDEQLSTSDIARLLADPYQMYTPVTPMFYFVGTGDVVAPVLTSPSYTNATATTIDGTVSTDEGAGTLYAVITESDTAPSVVQIQAGQDHTGSAAVWSGNQAVGASGTQTISAGSTLVPGTTYYFHFQQEDAAGTPNDSTVVTSTSFSLTALTTTATYAGGTISQGSIGHYAAGTSDSGSATHMIDAGLVSADDEFNGLTLHNDTDTASVLINDSTASTDRLDFTTGSVDFTSNDDYRITATISSSDVWYCESTATVSSGSVDIDWYIYDDSASTYTEVYTQTINGLSEADGTYNTALDANGVLTLTEPSTGGQFIQDLIQNLTQDLTSNLAS